MDLLEGHDRAVWTAGDGKALTAGQFGRPEGHVGLRTTEAPGGLRQRVLELRTGATGTLRGRFRRPAAGPRRLYLLPRLPQGEPAARLAVTPVAGAVTSEVELAAGSVADHPCLVVEVPVGERELDWGVRSDGGPGPTRVLVDEAWLVDLPVVLLDLASAPPPKGWAPTPAAAGASVVAGGTVPLRDGYSYGRRGWVLPLGPAAGVTGWHAEWPVRLPDGPAVLRGLLGFVADAPAGSKARVALKLVGAVREWPLMANLEVAVPGADGSAVHPEPSVVIEVPLPREAAGQEGALVLEVTAAAEVEARLGVPCLNLSLP
jgi:hypothetical protein